MEIFSINDRRLSKQRHKAKPIFEISHNKMLFFPTIVGEMAKKEAILLTTIFF